MERTGGEGREGNKGRGRGVGAIQFLASGRQRLSYTIEHYVTQITQKCHDMW